LQNRSSSDLQSRYTESRKDAALAVKKSKEKSWEEFGRRLASNLSWANKVFWQTIRRLRGKRSNFSSFLKDPSSNILSDENEIVSTWRKCFKDFFKLTQAKNDDTHEQICFWEEEVFTAREVAAAISYLKSEKAAGEDKIRPELLKALNSKEILWLTRMCQVA